MKNKSLLLGIVTLICSCTPPAPSEKYAEAQKKYDGVYYVTGIDTDSWDNYVLFDEIEDKNGIVSFDGSLYEQFSRKVEYTGWHSLGDANVSVDSPEGTGNIFFGFHIQSILSYSEPPYTVSTPVDYANRVIYWSQYISFQVNTDLSISWTETDARKEEAGSSISKYLLSPAEVVFFDGKKLDIRFNDYPIYDHKTQKLIMISAVYHLER